GVVRSAPSRGETHRLGGGVRDGHQGTARRAHTGRSADRVDRPVVRREIDVRARSVGGGIPALVHVGAASIVPIALIPHHYSPGPYPVGDGGGWKGPDVRVPCIFVTGVTGVVG